MKLKEIKKNMEGLKDWSLEPWAIQKEFNFGTFAEALDFVNRVGKISEEAGHHPDIVILFSSVRIVLTTHSEKEVTQKDCDLARKIDDLQNVTAIA